MRLRRATTLAPRLIELTPETRIVLTGATGGLGRVIALELAARGARLVLSARNSEQLVGLAKKIGGADYIPADLADSRDVDRLADEAHGADILIANAALPASGAIDDFTPEQIDRALDVNLRAPILLAKSLKDPMIARGSGHLVFVSSLSGKVATPGSALYSATKFGLRGYASGLRQDFHGTGVGVSTIFPGAVREAGMWAETGIEMPRGIGTSRPHQVAAAVIRAIERNKGEIDVAPFVPRLSSKVAQVAPRLNAGLVRRLGGHELAAQVGAAQANKR